MVCFVTRCGCSKEMNWVCDEEPPFIDLPMLPAAGPKALPEGAGFDDLGDFLESRRFDRTYRNRDGIMVYRESPDQP